MAAIDDDGNSAVTHLAFIYIYANDYKNATQNRKQEQNQG